MGLRVRYFRPLLSRTCQGYRARAAIRTMSGTSGAPAPMLIAVDGNGTMMKSDNMSLSDYSRSVFSRVQSMGIPVVLVTARPFSKALGTCELAGLKQYVVTENGARAVRIEDGASLYESWLSGPEVAVPLEQIRTTLQGQCFFVQLLKTGGLIQKDHPWLENEEQRSVAMKLFGNVVP